MRTLRPVWLWLLLPTLCAAGPKEDFFESSVRPVLVERCFSCHSQSAKKSKGGLLLDSLTVRLAVFTMRRMVRVRP